MTRPYETLFILKATATDEELAKQVKQVEDIIKKLGGTIDGSKPYGRRRLSFRVLRQTEGYYHLIEFHLETDRLDELKRLMRLNEQVVRFLVLAITRPVHQDAPAKQPEPATSR